MGGYERQEIEDEPRQARMVIHGATSGFHFYADLLGFFATVVDMLQFVTFNSLPTISLSSH